MEVLHVPKELSLTRNPIVYEVKTNDVNVKFIRLTLFVETFFGSDDFEEITKLSLPPDKDGKGIFYLNHILDRVLTVDYPDETDNDPQLHQNICRRFRVEIGEGSSVQFIDTKYALRGGFSFTHFAERQPDELLPNSTLMLTIRPRRRYISMYQRELLSLMFPTDGSRELRFRVNYIEKNQPPVEYFRMLTTRAFEPILVPVGFPSQAYDQRRAGFLIKNIEVFTWSDSMNGYEKITLIPYREETPFYHEFYWLNSLGAWDSLFCVGVPERFLAVNQEEFQHYYPHNYKAIRGEYQRFNTDFRIPKKVRVGYRQQKELLALQDFLSAEVRLERIGNQFYPIGITPGKYKIWDGNSNLNPLEFEYEYMFDELAVSPLM